MYRRAVVSQLIQRACEPRCFIQVLVGPRQTGKSTALDQMLDDISLPYYSVTADDPQLRSAEWFASEWRRARLLTKGGSQEALFVVDEAQKISHWADIAKQLWDEDTRNKLPLKVFLSGSSSLLLHKGMEDSLAGRCEVLYSTHWTFDECKEAFDYSLDDFLLFGGYPGAAQLRHDENRWARYIGTSIIDPVISQDILEMERVDKPSLLKALFSLGAAYSGQEISYAKLVGQLQDAGNTTTIAHYLDLLDKAGMLSGLQKYSGDLVRIRRSSPRIMVHNTALMTYAYGSRRELLLKDSEWRGHLVESSVGAYLIARAAQEGFEVYWWRTSKGEEIDFVIEKAGMLTALEVKSGRVKGIGGIKAFLKQYQHAASCVVGGDNCSLEDFLSGKVPLFVP